MGQPCDYVGSQQLMWLGRLNLSGRSAEIKRVRSCGLIYLVNFRSLSAAVYAAGVRGSSQNHNCLSPKAGDCLVRSRGLEGQIQKQLILHKESRAQGAFV
jgi:hypothetical protein